MASALTIAGFDPSGGAGVLADVRILARCGVNALAAVSALTVQDSRGVRWVEPVPPKLLRRQVETLFRDARIRAAKTGLLPNAASVLAVAESVPRGVPLVVDPVLASSGGFRFLDERGIAALRRALLPKAALVTPNWIEASSLTGVRIRRAEDLDAAALTLLELGASAVLVTGGDERGRDAVDRLWDRRGKEEYRLPRFPYSVHGTGCALSAAIAAGLALGRPLRLAVREAKREVHRRIARAKRFGRGRPILDFS